MIESALFFALGFLCAGFLALMIAPAIWRRAVHLTRRRIEASVPLTLNEITAEKDKVRADFAMSVRRLEMSLSEAKKRNAEQMVELARAREELARAAAEKEEKNAAIARLEGEAAELRSALDAREEELRQSALQLAEVGRALEERNEEVARLNNLYEEATFTSSGRQIDLVARESEIDKLAEDITRLREQKRALEQRLSEVERAATSREGEPAAEDTADRSQRLGSRLGTLMRENKKLKARLAELGQTVAGDANGEDPANALLRDEISDLAAQVVHLTILLEGQDSLAARAIAQAGKQPSGTGGRPTLADRIHALQQAAASR